MSLDDRSHCRARKPRPQKVTRSTDVLTPSPRASWAPGSRDRGYFFAILIQPLSHFYKGSFDSLTALIQ